MISPSDIRRRRRAWEKHDLSVRAGILFLAGTPDEEKRLRAHLAWAGELATDKAAPPEIADDVVETTRRIFHEALRARLPAAEAEQIVAHLDVAAAAHPAPAASQSAADLKKRPQHVPAPPVDPTQAVAVALDLFAAAADHSSEALALIEILYFVVEAAWLWQLRNPTTTLAPGA